MFSAALRPVSHQSALSITCLLIIITVTVIATTVVLDSSAYYYISWTTLNYHFILLNLHWHYTLEHVASKCVAAV